MKVFNSHVQTYKISSCLQIEIVVYGVMVCAFHQFVEHSLFFMQLFFLTDYML